MKAGREKWWRSWVRNLRATEPSPCQNETADWGWIQWSWNQFYSFHPSLLASTQYFVCCRQLCPLFVDNVKNRHFQRFFNTSNWHKSNSSEHYWIQHNWKHGNPASNRICNKTWNVAHHWIPFHWIGIDWFVYLYRYRLVCGICFVSRCTVLICFIFRDL